MFVCSKLFIVVAWWIGKVHVMHKSKLLVTNAECILEIMRDARMLMNQLKKKRQFSYWMTGLCFSSTLYANIKCKVGIILWVRSTLRPITACCLFWSSMIPFVLVWWDNWGTGVFTCVMNLPAAGVKFCWHHL